MDKNKNIFLVSITQEGKFFVARCPELGVTSQGGYLVEAQKNLKEAIEFYIASFELDDLPGVSVNSYRTTVEVENLQKVRSLTSYIKQG